MTGEKRDTSSIASISASITIVGVGPGDAQMLTLRGQQALQKTEADNGSRARIRRR